MLKGIALFYFGPMTEAGKHFHWLVVFDSIAGPSAVMYYRHLTPDTVADI